jgi:hypothetical protein
VTTTSSWPRTAAASTCSTTRAIQELTAEVRAKDAHLFEPRPALAINVMEGFADWGGSATFRGENPPEGSVLTYWIKAYTGDPVKLAIKSSGGVPVANLTGNGGPGLHRVTWDLKPTKDLLTQYGGEGSRFLPAGEYTVTLTHGKAKDEQKLKVEVAPGVETR